MVNIYNKLKMQEQLDKIEKDVIDIKNALLGTDYNKNGIVKRVEVVEKYQSRDKKQKWMVAGGFIVISFISKYIHKIF